MAWWTSFEEKHRAEVAAESAIFGGESGKKRQEDLRLRVIEHNIHVIAKYYARITVARLAQLLDLPADEVRSLPCSVAALRREAPRCIRRQCACCFCTSR